MPALEFFDDRGYLTSRLHACAAECTEDIMTWNDWQTHLVKRKGIEDSTGDGTYGASDTYKVTFWGSMHGTRREFFQHARRSLNNYVTHEWHLHNERVVNKLYK
jgi:hypothetical protein